MSIFAYWEVIQVVNFSTPSPWIIKTWYKGFPGGAVVENLPANAGDTGSSLVWEDPTCRGATRPVSHNYWACASGACAPQQERPRQWEARAPRWRVAPTCCNRRRPSHRNEDPTQPKINKELFKKTKQKHDTSWDSLNVIVLTLQKKAWLPHWGNLILRLVCWWNFKEILNSYHTFYPICPFPGYNFIFHN